MHSDWPLCGSGRLLLRFSLGAAGSGPAATPASVSAAVTMVAIEAFEAAMAAAATAAAVAAVTDVGGSAGAGLSVLCGDFSAAGRGILPSRIRRLLFSPDGGEDEEAVATLNPHCDSGRGTAEAMFFACFSKASSFAVAPFVRAANAGAGAADAFRFISAQREVVDVMRAAPGMLAALPLPPSLPLPLSPSPKSPAVPTFPNALAFCFTTAALPFVATTVPSSVAVNTDALSPLTVAT